MDLFSGNVKHLYFDLTCDIIPMIGDLEAIRIGRYSYFRYFVQGYHKASEFVKSTKQFWRAERANYVGRVMEIRVYIHQRGASLLD